MAIKIGARFMEQGQAIIEERIQLYFENGYNCAASMLKILGEIFGAEIHQQTLDSAVGMHGAGKYGAQCGLVEGALMFIGLYGSLKKKTKEEIEKNCYAFADSFKNEFNSLNCSDLRPEGFNPQNPPHLCKNLKIRAARFAVEYIKRI